MNPNWGRPLYYQPVRSFRFGAPLHFLMRPPSTPKDQTCIRFDPWSRCLPRNARRMPERGPRSVSHPAAAGCGGYTMKLTLQGTPPCGLRDASFRPSSADNWRLDGYSDRAIYGEVGHHPLAARGRQSGSPGAGRGNPSDEPVDGICTIPDVTEMRTDIDPLGIGQPTLAYHARRICAS